MRPKVFMTGHMFGSISSIKPVAIKLSEDGKVEPVVLAVEYSKAILDRDNVPYKTIDDYNANFDRQSISDILDVEDPDLVVMGASDTIVEKDLIPGGSNDVLAENLEQMTVAVAKDKGIPTITVMDFWGDLSQRFRDKDGNLCYEAEITTTLTEESRQELIEAGLTNVVVTGNPHFDTPRVAKENFSSHDLNRVREELGAEGFMLFHMSQPVHFYYGSDDSNPMYLGYTERTVLSDILQAIKGKDVSLIVSAHGQENPDDLKDILKGAGKVVQGYNSFDAILASDLVTSMFSTGLAEAALMEKPVLSLQPGLIKPDFLKTNDIGATKAVYGQVVPTVQRAIDDKAYRDELVQNQSKFKTEGNYTDNVVALVYDTLGL